MDYGHRVDYRRGVAHWLRLDRRGYDRIAGGECIIHIPARIEMCLKELGETGFDEQPFSYGTFGSRCSCSRD